MSHHIFVLAELSIHAGQLDAFKAVAAKLIAQVEANEPGTLVYAWHLNEDETEGRVFERYEDSEAALAHLGGFGPLAEDFLNTCEITRLTVCGKLSDELAETLAPFHTEVYGYYAGVIR